MWFFTKPKAQQETQDWRDSEEACFAPPGSLPPPDPRHPSLVSLAISLIEKGVAVPVVRKIIPAELTEAEVEAALVMSRTANHQPIRWSSVDGQQCEDAVEPAEEPSAPDRL